MATGIDGGDLVDCSNATIQLGRAISAELFLLTYLALITGLAECALDEFKPAWRRWHPCNRAQDERDDGSIGLKRTVNLAGRVSIAL